MERASRDIPWISLKVPLTSSTLDRAKCDGPAESPGEAKMQRLPASASDKFSVVEEDNSVLQTMLDCSA